MQFFEKEELFLLCYLCLTFSIAFKIAKLVFNSSEIKLNFQILRSVKISDKTSFGTPKQINDTK